MNETTKKPLDLLDDQIAALRARQDQIRARLDELVTKHPALKSYSPTTRGTR